MAVEPQGLAPAALPSAPAGGADATAPVQLSTRNQGALDRFMREAAATERVGAAAGAQDLEAVLVRLDEVLNLKETIRAQAAEIERLNGENNELAHALAAATGEKNDALAEAQSLQTAQAESVQKIAKLIDLVRVLQGGVSGPQAGDGAAAGRGGPVDLLVAEFHLPHSASRKKAVGLLGRSEVLKSENSGRWGPRGRADPCEQCVEGGCFCGSSGQGAGGPGAAGSLGEFGDPGASAEVRGGFSPAQAQISVLEARIQSLLLEREGLVGLYTARISELQASLARVRATLTERAERSERQLSDTSKQMVAAVRKTAELEATTLQLEGQLASLAAHGAAAAAEAKAAAEETLKSARREVHMLKQEHSRALRGAEERARGSVAEDARKCREELVRLQHRVRELENLLELTREKLEKCESRLRKVSEHNVLLRVALREYKEMDSELGITASVGFSSYGLGSAPRGSGSRGVDRSQSGAGLARSQGSRLSQQSQQSQRSQRPQRSQMPRRPASGIASSASSSRVEKPLTDTSNASHYGAAGGGPTRYGSIHTPSTRSDRATVATPPAADGRPAGLPGY